MQRQVFFAIGCALGTAAIALLPPVRTLLMGSRANAPQSLTEAVEIVDKLGLFHRYDGIIAGSGCLLVSESKPLPQSHRMNNPSHPSWIGTVAIYRDQAKMMVYNYDPSCSAVWGSLFVYGDPKLIEKLTGNMP